MFNYVSHTRQTWESIGCWNNASTSLDYYPLRHGEILSSSYHVWSFCCSVDSYSQNLKKLSTLWEKMARVADLSCETSKCCGVATIPRWVADEDIAPNWAKAWWIINITAGSRGKKRERERGRYLSRTISPSHGIISTDQIFRTSTRTYDSKIKTNDWDFVQCGFMFHAYAYIILCSVLNVSIKLLTSFTNHFSKWICFIFWRTSVRQHIKMKI